MGNIYQTVKVFLFLVSAILFSFVSACASQSDLSQIQEQLRKTFPNFKIQEVNKTAIPELYEVVGENGEILYYSPKGYLIFGELWTVEGKSITGERRQEIQTKMIKEVMNNLPYDKAVKIGKGEKIVVEISDPNCPHCQMVAKKLKERNDITKYVFFFPLSDKSKEKISYILCSKEPDKAYYEVYENPQKQFTVSAECKEKAEKALNEHIGLALKLRVRGTPFFIINQTPVVGANIPQIEELLKK